MHCNVLAFFFFDRRDVVFVVSGSGGRSADRYIVLVIMSTESAVQYASECCDEYINLYNFYLKSSCDDSLTHIHLHLKLIPVLPWLTRAWVTLGGELRLSRHLEMNTDVLSLPNMAH